MFVPQNEQGVIYFFASLAEKAGWRLIEIDSSFPDALYEHDGEQWRVEFEFVASNFVHHKHDFRRCDLIVCWLNDYEDCPMPIIALNNDLWMTASYRKADPKDLEIEYWKYRSILAETQLKTYRNRMLHSELAQEVIAGFDDDDNERRVRALELLNKGMSKKAIAQEIGVHRNTVAAWLNGHKKPEVQS